MPAGVIETELLTATKSKPQKDGEARQKYFGRIIRGVNQIDNKVWAALSKPSQDWAAKAIEIRNADADADVPEPDGEVPAAAPAAAAPVAQTAPAAAAPVAQAAPAAAEPAAPGRPVSKPTPTAAATATPAAAATGEKRGGTNEFRKLSIISQLAGDKKTSKDITAAVVAAGYKISESTASVLFAETTSHLKLMKEMNLLK